MRSALNCQQRWIENQEKMWQDKLGRVFGNLNFKTLHCRSCNIRIARESTPENETATMPLERFLDRSTELGFQPK